MLSLINICCSTHDKPANPSILDFHFHSLVVLLKTWETRFTFFFPPQDWTLPFFLLRIVDFGKLKRKFN